MNITFLIGNGFDINLGLKTRYIDFYKYYVKTESTTSAIKRFKDEINNFIKKDCHKEDESAIDWRDLEVAIGKWTVNLNAEDVHPLYVDIIDSLKAYLVSEFRTFDADAFDRQDFFKYLLDPGKKNYPRIQKEEIRQFYNSFAGADLINVISFNYTRTIEMLSGFDGRRLTVGNNIVGHSTIIDSVFHIHQTLDDEEILVGLDNVSQLANESFQTNSHICNLLVKPKTNSLLGTGVDRDCEQVIANTNLFVLFGSSSGITDMKWWRAVCYRLQQGNTRMLFFVHHPTPQTHPNLNKDINTERAIKDFISNAGLKSDVLYDVIYPRCYVSFSRDMFRLTPSYNGRLATTQTFRVGKTDVEIKIVDKGMKYVALSVDAPDEVTGVKAEYEWVSANFPEYKIGSQSINSYMQDKNSIPYDVIHIESETNSKDIYFEISSYFGKNGMLDLMSMPKDRIQSGLMAVIKERY